MPYSDNAMMAQTPRYPASLMGTSGFVPTSANDLMTEALLMQSYRPQQAPQYTPQQRTGQLYNYPQYSQPMPMGPIYPGGQKDENDDTLSNAKKAYDLYKNYKQFQSMGGISDVAGPSYNIAAPAGTTYNFGAVESMLPAYGNGPAAASYNVAAPASQGSALTIDTALAGAGGAGVEIGRAHV